MRFNYSAGRGIAVSAAGTCGANSADQRSRGRRRADLQPVSAPAPVLAGAFPPDVARMRPWPDAEVSRRA